MTMMICAAFSCYLATVWVDQGAANITMENNPAYMTFIGKEDKVIIMSTHFKYFGLHLA